MLLHHDPWSKDIATETVSRLLVGSGRACTEEMGEWDSPAFMPVMPQVSTPPRPLVLKEEPKMMSILFLSVAVISSRHMLDMAAGQQEA